jgi:hypothetical protein
MTTNQNYNEICEYCANSFSNKERLKSHQLTTAYCLKIQGKLKFECEYCLNDFATKQSLNIHSNNCKSKQFDDMKKELDESKKENTKLKKDLVKSKKEIEDLKKQVEIRDAQIEIYKDSHTTMKTIAEKSSIPTININSINSNNNNINSNNKRHTYNNKYSYLLPFNLSTEYISEKVNNNFTNEHLEKGQKGVANFAYTNLLLEDNKLKYVCGDPNRYLFYYKNADGIVEKDDKAKNLIEMISPDIFEKSKELFQQITENADISLLDKMECKSNCFKIHEIKDNSKVFLKELSFLTHSG